VTLKTIHGRFNFGLQKYQIDGEHQSYFALSGQMHQGYVSVRLQEVAAYYSNRMSYEEVARLIQRMSGDRLLSDQSIYQIVNRKAQQVSQTIQQDLEAIEGIQDKTLISIQPDINLYDKASPEILLFEDGIGVKAQSEQRQSPAEAHHSSSLERAASASGATVSTDIILLQTAPQKFEYLSAPITEVGEALVPLELMVRAKLKQVYGQREDPLPIVVISDGARSIRNRLSRLFAEPVSVILDWYHLCHKVRQLMAMIAANKHEKQEHLKMLLSDLWQGQVEQALTYLKAQVTVRNADKFQELCGYLEKHQAEIINYEQRRSIGKPIGSGRMEKAVDQVIGKRQKRKGMSWRPQGSRALALLKVLELNGKWQQAWVPSQVG
jgi:hypothetical protein